MPDLPHSLDRFEIVRILGKGGMGSVYLARDQRLGRQVALKVLNSEDLASDERRARFLREAKTAAAIRHQNVATIYEVGETDDGLPFLVMEYCEGETLAQRLRRRPEDAGEFLAIARQIAAGLAAVHDNGAIHRDIKTANIMIEPTGLVKILDFGLAKLLPREGIARSFESTSGHFFGTLHYLSPEQTRGETSDERSDLFSAGVVMYQMASGHLPFNAEVPLMVLDRIRDAEPEPFTPLDPAFPPAAARVIGMLLQKKPADRYQNAHELLADLEAIDTPTLRLSTHHTRSAIGRTIARPRWMQLSIIVAILIAGAAAIVFVRDHNGGKSTDAATTTASASGPVKSIAVLPLDNLAGNQKDDFLSVSLADALVTKMQAIPSLQGRPTSAARQYHNKKVDASTAGKQLQVDGVLEGHFLAAGDLVRVNLQLTDARSGYSIWADSVNGKRTNLLQLIDDVSNRTVSALNEKIGAQNSPNQSSQPRSSNPKAYEEYLRARALNGSLLPADINQQIAALKHAIELDPTFAAAYADLSIALSLGTARGLVNDPNALSKSEWYARQAVRLDANLAQAHLALGRIFVRSPDRFREATRENLAAVRLHPSDSQSLWTIASDFVAIGDTEKAQCTSDRDEVARDGPE